MYEVKVDDEKCVGCGECVDICPEEVFELQDENQYRLKLKSALAAKVALKSVKKRPYR